MSFPFILVQKYEKNLIIQNKNCTFAPAFRVIAGRKIGELPVMLRWNDTTNLIIKQQWI